MRRTALLPILLGPALALGAVFACSSTDDDDGADQLSSEHVGWGNPGCWSRDCHKEADTHNSELQPYECVSCHGKNGAPNGHGGDTPCGECHTETHGNNGFPDPDSCVVCH